MQVEDVAALEIDVALGGIDQRGTYMLARDVLPEIGQRKPTCIFTPLMPGLKGGKMSASKPESKIDILDDFDEIKICTAYKDKRNGDLYENYPANTYIHNHLEPVYETLPGWKQDISGIREFSELPENAKKFVLRVEALTGVPVEIISVGANREQTIIRNFPLS